MTASSSPRRLGLLLEYEGTGYHGSQYQKNGTTIQSELEKAVSNLTSEFNRVALAGRTDAGVHAYGQVASFLTTSQRPISVFPKALNYYLPEDIAVRSAVELPIDFDIRHQARSRLYHYTIHNGVRRTPLLRHSSWHLPKPLNQETMEEAVATLLGKHSFAAFTQPSLADGKNTERMVSMARLSWQMPLLRLELEANAFLPNQVRRTIGALVEVGRGKITIAAFREMVLLARPGAASLMAPPHGLCLMKVRYERELFEDECTNENLQS